MRSKTKKVNDRWSNYRGPFPTLQLNVAMRNFTYQSQNGITAIRRKLVKIGNISGYLARENPDGPNSSYVVFNNTGDVIGAITQVGDSKNWQIWISPKILGNVTTEPARKRKDSCKPKAIRAFDFK